MHVPGKRTVNLSEMSLMYYYVCNASSELQCLKPRVLIIKIVLTQRILDDFQLLALWYCATQRKAIQSDPCLLALYKMSPMRPAPL